MENITLDGPRTEPELKDVQKDSHDSLLPIDHAGVTGLRYPVTVLDRSAGRQETVATISMSVDLPRHFKGTHMSRFIEVLNRHRGEVTMRTMPAILGDLRKSLQARKAKVEMRFPYFIEKAAPVSGARALMDYDCSFVAAAEGEKCDFIMSIDVPVGSLCPCSKAISDYGAHNQRGIISIKVRCAEPDAGFRADEEDPNAPPVFDSAKTGAIVWLEELVDIADASASCPVYPILKRPDERHVTMKAFENPAFVEDMVRNAATQLMADPRITWFMVRAENQESIHNHNAFAEIEWTRP